MTIEGNDNSTLSEKTNDSKSSVPWWTSCRLGLAVPGFFGFVNVYALRVNMSVAIVCMVNLTALKQTEDNFSQPQPDSSHCGLIETGEGNHTISESFKDGEFVWEKPIQGVILGSFFWGYLLTQIPGGWLATKVGGKRVYGYSMMGATIATFLTPVAAQTHYIFLIVLRVIVGITSGVCYPSMHALWGSWAPPMERSKLVSFTYAGAQVGNVITFPLAGLLCKYGFAGGWPSIFYLLGIMSTVWLVLWMWLVSDSPALHPRITKAERDYILTSLSKATSTHQENKEQQQVKIPWCKMATSLPVLAILVANITSDWGTYTLLTSIPTYMNEVLKLDISTNGLYSALPYVAFWLMINVAGWVADFILSRGCCSLTVTRKCFTITGMLVPAVLLIALGYIDCTMPMAAIVLLVLGVSLTGIQYSGWIVNHMDIAPMFAGILFGISNSIAAITGFLSPVLVGLITKDKKREQWQTVFYISSGFYIFGSIFFGVFSSGEVQGWAESKKEDEEPETLPLDPTAVDIEMKVVTSQTNSYHHTNAAP